MIRAPKTIKEVLASRQCSGCGACAAAAPPLIEMAETVDENRRPVLPKSLKVELEIMVNKACPEIATHNTASDSTIADAAWGPVLEVWQGHAKDEEIRFKGSSGGATTALALFALEQGGFHGALHIKARQDAPEKNLASISTDREGLLTGCGSRYAPSSVCDQLPLVEAAPGKCVVIGKPCDIRGAVAAATAIGDPLQSKIGLTLAIFCAGVPSHEGTKSLLASLGSGAEQKLQSLQYRGEGWPGDMVATWKGNNGLQSQQRVSYKKGWGDILQKYRQWRCHICEDHTGESADIAIGDPWQTPLSDDEKGSSLIVVRTARGRAFLRKAVAAGYIQADKKDPPVLFEAQPNLFETKGAVWGRKLALRLMLQKTSAMTADSFKCWLALPAYKKGQSVFGTFKRILQRRLYGAKKTKWLLRDGAQ